MSRNGHFMLGAGHGVPELARAAERFSPTRRPISYGGIVTTPEMQNALARSYRALPDFDPAAVPSFEAMRQETKKQFDYMTKPQRQGGLGISVEVTHEDPYSGPSGLFHDLFHDRRMKVLSTQSTGAHPFFSDDENDMFRAVHDVFGHAATGRGFDRHGEEAAFQAHSRMFSPIARRAMATETRGQNAALITSGGQFQAQKVALIPQRLARPTTMLGAPASLATSRQQARVFNQEQFGGLLGALREATA
jgi:hypothetical protein